MFPRSSGVLMHLASMPGPYGIGSMGSEARHFIDFLHRGGQSYWQILPLVPPGGWNSPYMSPSSAAGNPLFIDLDELVEEGMLSAEDVRSARYHGSPDRISYAFVEASHYGLLRKAFFTASKETLAKVEEFAKEHKDWLEDYSLFVAIHGKFQKPLQEWPDKKLIRRDPAAMAKYAEELVDEINLQKFLQYLFFRQWSALKQYANDRGISVIGDIPFYVSSDSVDVWVNPELFRVSAARKPRAVAGVPADLFNDQGQLWGNPLYNWSYHEKTGYAWWCNRIRQSVAFYDVIRIDHFRAFYDYWEIPADSETALTGKWKRGPGMKLLDAFRKNVPEAEFIAEDLGDLSEGAMKFVHTCGLPGMNVLTDAFNDVNGGSGFLPHKALPDSVMYTGTHDTPTFVQWYADMANPEQQNFARNYLHVHEDEGIGWCAIAGAWISPCGLAMTTMQDILGLGVDGRMNFPGTVGLDNWSWRVRREALNDYVADRLRYVTGLYGRLR